MRRKPDARMCVEAMPGLQWFRLGYIQRGTLFPKRIRLMADWATYCGIVRKSGGNVVDIREGSAA